jgi:hypothetical protein
LASSQHDNFRSCIIGHPVQSRHLCNSSDVNQPITRDNLHAPLRSLDNL